MIVGWTVGAGVAVGAATFAALLFAVAAVLQQRAVRDVVDAGPSGGGLVRLGALRALLGTPGWLGGVLTAAVASLVHAGALVLAPVSIVQPIGVLAVPFAVLIAARRTGRRPSPRLLVAVVICLVAVTVFVALAHGHLDVVVPPGATVVVAAGGVVVLLVAGLAGLAVWASGRVRCLLFAAAGATAFGLVSVLLRLLSLHLAAGSADVDVVGVLVPAVGIGVALLVGGWSVQQAHASGPAAVVVGCMTVVDPMTAVVLGIVMLGEGGASGAGVTFGLVGCAAAGVYAVLMLSRHHPDAVAGNLPTVAPGLGRPDVPALTHA